MQDEPSAVSQERDVPVGETYVYEVQLRWSDEDRMGHLNNTRYLTFAEDARTRWFAMAPRDEGDQAGFILARMEVDYLQQVRTADNDWLKVVNTVLGVGRSSLRIQQEIQRMDGEVVNRVIATQVHFDYDRDSSVPWTDTQRAWLERFATVKPDATDPVAAGTT